MDITPFIAHRKQFLYRAYKLTSSWSVAEDILHDAWVRLLQHQHDGTPVNHLSYGYQTITNLCLDRRRYYRRRIEIELSPQIKAITGNPEIELNRSMLEHRIEKMITRLTPEQQRVVAMEIDELSGKQMAAEIGVSEKAAKATLY